MKLKPLLRDNKTCITSLVWSASFLLFEHIAIHVGVRRQELLQGHQGHARFFSELVFQGNKLPITNIN